MVEAAAEADEKLAEKYLEGEELTADEIVAGLRLATLKLDLVPVFCGSAFRNKGVQTLLDGLIALLPSPLDVDNPQGSHPDDEEQVVSRQASDSEPLSALVFKIWPDAFAGHLVFVRVYSGKLKTGAQVRIARTRKDSRIGRLVMLHADKREEVDVLHAGEIGAVVGLKTATTGDTLHAKEAPIVYESMTFPEPVISVAVEPRTRADADRLQDAISKLTAEDPTLKSSVSPDTGQTILSGMGELHLDIIRDRLVREFDVKARVGKPQVAYREALQKTAEAEGRYVRQTGGKGQYGHVKLRVEPGPRGEGFSFVNATVGGVVPKEFISSIEAGAREAAQEGLLAGFELVDAKVTLLDGSTHDVDSSEVAFKIASSMAFKDAAKTAGVVLLEPSMAVEVVVPEQYLGAVMGDLTARRGRVDRQDTRGTAQVLGAKVPLAEMFEYATSLRSLTQGRATFTMELDEHAKVPAKVADAIVARIEGRALV
jgi:elongation factor G